MRKIRDMRKIIVSRHPAVVEFVRAERPDFRDSEVMTFVTEDDVRGAHVIGNLPLNLAALCGRYEIIEFSGVPPWRAEYGVLEMRAAGARIVEYRVREVPPHVEGEELEEVASAMSSGSVNARRMRVRAPRGTVFPARGDWVDCGQIGLDRLFEFVPNPEFPLAVLLHGKIRESRGVLLVHEFLGRYESITLLFAGEGAIFRAITGYKHRHQSVLRVKEGALVPANPSELVGQRRSLVREFEQGRGPARTWRFF